MKKTYYEVNFKTGQLVESDGWGYDTEKEAWDVYKKYLTERQEVLLHNIIEMTNELQQVISNLNKIR